MTENYAAVILALNATDARTAAKERGLDSAPCLFVSSERVLHGRRLTGCRVVETRRFWERRDAGDIMTALHTAMTAVS